MGTYRRQERGKKTPRRKRAREEIAETQPQTAQETQKKISEAGEIKLQEACEELQAEAMRAAKNFATLRHGRGSELLARRAAKLARRAASRSSQDLLQEGRTTLRKTDGELIP